MRVNIYAEEMTDRVEIIEKTVDGHTFTGLRIYLELPVTIAPPHVCPECGGGNGVDDCRTCDGSGETYAAHKRGPFIHRPGDDDSSAVTFWGKADLRDTLAKALEQLDAFYADRNSG